MKIIRSDEKLENIQGKCLFLAGPTPRDNKTISWRIEAIDILYKLNFQGTVLIPECSGGVFENDYLDQVEWEETGLTIADCAVFYIPRVISTMPAFTTNVEFGRWIVKSKGTKEFLYGRPVEAEKCKYLDWLYKLELGKEPFLTLEDTLKGSIK